MRYMSVPQEKLTEPYLSRFNSYIKKLDNGCWQWTRGKTGTGYGMFWTGKRDVGVHRLSYLMHKGKIPDGLCIDHLCKNRACVNPDHMEIVTRGENSRRGDHAGRKKTHCAKGHEYNKKNTYWYRKHRICRACQRIKWNKWCDKNREHRNYMARLNHKKRQEVGG